MNETLSEGRVNHVLERARRHSTFLAQQLEKFPQVANALAADGFENAVAVAHREGSGSQHVAAALRRERSALALALAVADLAGELPLERLTRALSDFADRAVESALRAAFAERFPGVEPAGFSILALGKLGSRELNYSSDIDLLFLFDPATLPTKSREEPGQAAVRIGQRMIELLQKREADGYVFRVDLRLRPSPEATPIALPVNAAISYYESSALPWERAAFIRARCIAGDEAVGRYFLDAIHPFVWRRSLDFGAVGEIQSISRRIRDHYAQGQGFGPGFDLKRGRGGIREIEFFAQIHQLIHGGREPGLRAPATLDALEALAAAQRIAGEEAADLAASYRLLRTVEHRLQMVDDRQTHSLPADREALNNVAMLHGLRDGDALLDQLRDPVGRVAAIYGELSGEGGERLPGDPPSLEATLRSAGFADAGAARLRIESWRSGRARSLRTVAARDAFEAMLPSLIAAFGKAPDPMRAMNRFDDLVTRLPSGVNFYRLLEARPGVAELLGTLLSHAPALAQALGERPELLDGLLDATAFTLPPSVEALAEEFAQVERAGEDYQLMLDRVRWLVNERRFALGAQLILARSDPLEVAAGYARVAEAAIQVLASATVAEFEKVHGRVPGSELLILALGRFGGEALTHASDLDIIYLFSGTHDAQSDGLKPLRATDYFNRLAPRVTAALSVPTSSGPLYQVDTQLRPSGKDGLIAVSLPSFERYQREQAWTWEHMALTRGRPVFGSDEGRRALAQVLLHTLRQPRDPVKLVADAARMRREMAIHKPPSGPFDIKKGEGGLIDLEFAVHTLQLRHGIGLDPHLETALEALEAAGLVSAGIDPALRLLTRMLVTFRLVSPGSSEPPPATRLLVAAACGLADWDALLAAHTDARRRVAELWSAVSRETQTRDLES